ncbi:MAG: DUF924 domain-containing protein [Leptolyngbya sp. DLM2.Bin15]|nr:MAG: DUF924 domain-containing protein [Leptolyngbya sp. DLM2.Bin15]
MHTVDSSTILAFWFGEPIQTPNYAERRSIWFGKDPDLDQEIGDRFLSTYRQAAAGELDHWQQTPLDCLALVIVLDQFSRNLFRQQAQAFATDGKALSIAQGAIAQGFDQQLHPVHRIFLYLPLEHSEDRAIQQESVTLFQRLAEAYPELNDTYDYALRHQRVIEQFGRFPHRNIALGRDSTPEEQEFLKQPGSSF